MKERTTGLRIVVGALAGLLFALTGCGGDGLVQKKKREIQEADPNGPQKVQVEGLRLADRAYVSAFFTDVFGPAPADLRELGPANASYAVKSLVREFGSDLGGPCDPAYRGEALLPIGYDQGIQAGLPLRGTLGRFLVAPNPETNDTRVHGNQFTCADATEARIPILPAPLKTRFGVIIRGCETTLGGINSENRPSNGQSAQLPHPDYIVRTAATLAMGGDGNNPSSADAIGFPDDAKIKQAWKLFFNDKPITPEAMRGLQGVVSASNSQTAGKPASEKNLDGWRFLLLTLCMSPEWQVL